MLKQSFRFALRGILKALRSERNFRIMTACAVLVAALGFLLGISALEWCVILLCCGGILALELLNTAIECVVDMITPEYSVMAERAKDITAGASLVFCVFSFFIGLIVFLPRVARLFG